ncbi:MAG: disulfide bond formation protein B [Deltaproteobacteria bacterium]|nr:disulfide bond formation protein B [Deltaproteobacteria bacterium]
MATALGSQPAAPAGWWWLFAAWLTAAGATAGSLFFSSVMDLPPCVLCWYQRIALFPLVLVLAAGLFPFDARVVRYALPLAAAGWAVAGYHNLLYWGVVPESLSPCSEGVSCTNKHLDLFGVVSIPLLSWVGFTVLIALVVVLKRRASS